MKSPRPSNYPTAVDDMMKLAAEADGSHRYKVERGDGFLLYASHDLSMAQAIFALWKERRPHGRYVLRQNVEVLERWPPE
jgi:hypothetical protein